MNWPAPMSTKERLPNRVDGTPYSAEVLVFDAKGGIWSIATYCYESVEGGNEGVWTITGELVDAAEISHWIPLPPAPPQS